MTTLSPQQEEAIRTVVPLIRAQTPQPVTYIGGYAGTGKSTILPFILEELGFPPESVAFCAPTGKAAKVMSNKLRAQNYPNAACSTIHSLIYRAKPAPIATLENDLYAHQTQAEQMLGEAAPDERALVKASHEFKQLQKAIERLKADLSNAYREDKINWQLNVDSPIQLAQLIVVDEGSMVGKQMAADLMHFGVPILVMGDPGQLPPVQDEEGLTAGTPDYFLTEIHRQAADNPILHLATLARQGRELPIGDYGEGVRVVDRSKYVHDFNPAVQVLVGTNKTRWKITRQFRHDMPRSPVAGEPLIVCKNSRQHPKLVNGAPVTALRDGDVTPGRATFEFAVEDEDGARYDPLIAFQGLFEEHYHGKGGFTAPDATVYRARKNSVELDWAYAITVHKSQGSQWDDILLVDESAAFRRDADKHLYTGITRAAKTLTILV